MKKILLFSLIACLGFVGSGFAGSCELTVVKAGPNDPDFIYLGASGNNGFACNRFGGRSCDPGQIIFTIGNFRLGDKKALDIDGDFWRCSKGSKDKWVWIDTSKMMAELPECNGFDNRKKVEFGGTAAESYELWADKEYIIDGTRGYVGLCKQAKVEAEKSSKGSTSQKTKVSTSWAGELNPCEGGACAVYARGGDVEQKGCLKNSSATNFVDKWKSEGSSCDATDAKTARCFKQKNVAGDDVMSCAAKICNDDSALWLYRKSENNYQSYGLCRKQNWLQKEFCDKNHKSCGKCGGKCMLNVFEWTNGSFGKTNAFYDDKLCVCVADDNGGGGEQKEQKPNVCPEKDCKDTCNVTINESIKCNNGKKFESKKTVKVCKECVEQQNMTCDQYQETINKCDDLKCIENRLKQLTEIDKLLKEWCGAGYSTTTPDNSAQINAAKNTISSFFSSAESSANVWKDKDGNFNTARLASDLTAGVVLGTVGGVVSGVVIKKKQVEKGFDALHCTVGGQTVADWGDIFNVGLRR